MKEAIAKLEKESLAKEKSSKEHLKTLEKDLEDKDSFINSLE